MSKEDTQRWVGKILEEEGFVRDAIHMAVLPVIASTKLFPGQDIGFVNHLEWIVTAEATKKYGIVDPFLSRAVKPGERFFMWLYPNTITGLTHQWQHPLIEERAAKVKHESETWLRDFAARQSFDFEELISGARFGDVITAHGTDLHGASQLGEPVQEFWKHLEAFTGETFSEEQRENVIWSCSC